MSLEFGLRVLLETSGLGSCSQGSWKTYLILGLWLWSDFAQRFPRTFGLRGLLLRDGAKRCTKGFAVWLLPQLPLLLATTHPLTLASFALAKTALCSPCCFRTLCKVCSLLWWEYPLQPFAILKDPVQTSLLWSLSWPHRPPQVTTPYPGGYVRK